MNKKIKKPISQRISEALDIPAGVLGTTSFIEGAGNRELNISGCLGLRTYTEELVVLELCDGILSVRGEALELKSFTGGEVAIFGVLFNIHYGEEVSDNAC